MELQAILATLIVFLVYAGGLAAGIQVAVNELKPVFLNYVKERVTTDQYLIVIYVTRAGLTAIAYFGLWGGIAATRAIVELPFIPDAGIAVGTIAIVVLGEEIIHPLLERIYILRDIAKKLGNPPTDPPAVG